MCLKMNIQIKWKSGQLQLIPTQMKLDNLDIGENEE